MEKLTTGEAFRDGRPVASVRVTERGEMSATRVPLAGSTSLGVKPKPIRGETTIVFEEIYDGDFASELERLASAWNDVEQKRTMRDQGTGAVSFELVLHDERRGRFAVTWPDIGLGAVETLIFRLRQVG